MSALFVRSLIVVAMLAGSAVVLRAQALSTTAQPSATGVLRGDQRRVSLTVATRAIARGEVLQTSDIARADTVIIWRWNGLAPDTTPALPGWVARRPIAAGEVLRAPAVSPPPVIESGATVKAIWQDGPLTLVINGVATNSAIAGAPVGVRIDRSRRLDGVAVAPNTVRLR